MQQLGAFRIPLEVIPFSLPLVFRQVRQMAGNRSCEQRMQEGQPVLTDEGNLVLDADFGMLDDPAGLALRFSEVPGIVEHGLFVGMTRRAYIGTQSGLRILETPA